MRQRSSTGGWGIFEGEVQEGHRRVRHRNVRHRRSTGGWGFFNGEAQEGHRRCTEG